MIQNTGDKEGKTEGRRMKEEIGRQAGWEGRGREEGERR